MDKAEHIKYQLQTLASYEPKDLDHPVFEVAYEDESGREGFLEVCCVDLAERTLDRIAELEGQVDRLRGQLQNCVNHLGHASRRSFGKEQRALDAVIDTANKALYETLIG